MVLNDVAGASRTLSDPLIVNSAEEVQLPGECGPHCK